MPFHVDEQAGKEAFGGITAPGVFVLALKQRLVHQMPSAQSVIASLGFDEVRFQRPVRPGDTLQLRREWISKRVSNSKPDRGIATMRFSLINQHGIITMSHLDTVLVRRRLPDGIAEL
jgi:acyl dehydratase